MKKIFLKLIMVVLTGTLMSVFFCQGEESQAPAKPERVVKIALTAASAVAEQKGWYKEEFSKYGARVELVKALWFALPAMFERGDVNIGGNMQYALILQVINGFDPVVIWQSKDINPHSVAIIVLKDSPINKLADLKGKTLAVSRWTCPYFGSFETLQLNHLPLDSALGKGEIRYVNMTTDGANNPAILLSGKVDAMAVHPTTVTALYLQGIVKEIGTATAGGSFVHGGRAASLAPRKWVNENPDLVKAYNTVFNKTREWIISHPSEAAEIAAKELRLPKEVVEYQLRDPGNTLYSPQEVDHAAAVESVQFFQKWAATNGDDLLAKKSLSDAQIDALLDKRFFKGGSYYADDSTPESTHLPVTTSQDIKTSSPSTMVAETVK